MLGNTATSAANTKVPAHVGWTRCSPLCSLAGKKLSLLLLRPDKLQATLPPRNRCRPMGQSFLPSNMCSQIASVHHHVYCVKCSEVGAISQDMGKNVSPARVSNLTCSLISQRGMCAERQRLEGCQRIFCRYHHLVNCVPSLNHKTVGGLLPPQEE